ncbi:MAG: hybrid sensor histidine kinase/response regulator [Planctomycetes bacterium]|nr:hybrid sensor histidine kinase/response regulator [Planctomycetota bacterium]
MSRIVLIDDEVRLQQTLARFLEQQGHHVVRGTSFADVENHLYPGRFEVLITDIVMPEVDGMKVLREVVEARGCLEPVILITGEPNLETAAEAVRRGAFDYISKPVTKDKLLEAVGRGLRHVQLLRERDSALKSEMDILRNLARIGESASVLSHEIRTPITSLRHALRAVGDKLGIEHRILVEEFLVNLGKIETMLGKTLSLVKPLELKRRPTDLERLVADCVRDVQALPSMVEFSVGVDMPDRLTADVDAQLLGDVLTNLLRNAGEASDGRCHVDVMLRCQGGQLAIEVTDDGPGVPDHHRDEIFRPFRSFKEYGTGIGLAFSRKVVESHGGTIRLVDKPGVGACFRIEIPGACATSGSAEEAHHE